DANDTKKIKEILEKEREVYDKYISGEVYSVEIFKVETCNLGHEHKESVDTICGFYSVEDAKADCLEIIKNLEEEEIVNE
ncbi:MAG: hypothetical protein Q8P15_04105, partial [Nanoarchaeota archaeon]|nr:hypothetical protein [Nanoarchaeota archaeon]